MPAPSTTVEVGLDLSGLGGPFFILDDSVQGVLDNTEYTLGGTIFVDITDDVRSLSTRRGKSRELDRFTAGLASVQLNNFNRDYDPLNSVSPYFGQIVPRRDLRIITDGTPVFYGYVEDWSLQYDVSGESLATAEVADAFNVLSEQELTAQSTVAQLTGARINSILDLAEINWPAAQRSIDAGVQTLQDDAIEAGTNAIEYLQLVSQSEPGSFFVAKNGDVAFRDRSNSPSSTSVVLFSDDGVGVPFVSAQVVFGSELLFNRVIVSRLNGGTAIADSTPSQNAYGITVLEQSDLLLPDDATVASFATFLLSQFSEPEYRFESLTVSLDDLDAVFLEQVLGLEIGDTGRIKFTPNGVGAQIDKFAAVIGVSHEVTPASHRVTFNFQTLDFASFVLDDAEFGILDTSRLGF